MRCSPLLESQNLGKMPVPLKAHKRKTERGREREVKRESKLKRKSLAVTSERRISAGF